MQSNCLAFRLQCSSLDLEDLCPCLLSTPQPWLVRWGLGSRVCVHPSVNRRISSLRSFPDETAFRRSSPTSDLRPYSAEGQLQTAPDGCTNRQEHHGLRRHPLHRLKH